MPSLLSLLLCNLPWPSLSILSTWRALGASIPLLYCLSEWKSFSRVRLFATVWASIIVHGILQTRILEWLAFPFFRRSSQPRYRTQVSHVAGGFFTSWATMEAQEYWSGYPIVSPGDLPDPGIKPGSPALQVGSLPTELSGKPNK